MEITINQIKGNIIKFSSKCGVAVGMWEDEDIPQIKTYDVEINVDGLLKYEDIKIEVDGNYILDSVEQGVYISALLSEYSKDGLATFRIDDSLLEVETLYDKRFYLLYGKFVSFVSRIIKIYDSHVY